MPIFCKNRQVFHDVQIMEFVHYESASVAHKFVCDTRSRDAQIQFLIRNTLFTVIPRVCVNAFCFYSNAGENKSLSFCMAKGLTVFF